MTRLSFILFILLVCSSHDMFLKLKTYHLPPSTSAQIELYNGTFDRSDNIITRDRMIDVSLVGRGQRISVDSSKWSDINKTTTLSFMTGEEGTWVAGVSTFARNIELDAESFNDYLEHDGVLDMLESREELDELDEDAVEKYSKHVKLIYQVGEQRTNDWNTVLDYPIEFVPLSNPYDAKVGQEISFRLLRDGQPLPNQIVYTASSLDHEHEHEHNYEGEDDHHHHVADQLITDSEGMVTVELKKGGVWYLRTIHMTKTEEEGLTHESNWATITFETASDQHHEHDHNDNHGHTHTHADGTVHHHDHAADWKKYLPWGGVGLVVLLGGFALLRRKS